MNRILSIAALLAFSTAAFAAPAPDGNFDRTLSVSSQPDLYVSTGSGTIKVHPGTGTQIHVVGHVHASWSAFGDVNARIQHIVDNPPVTQSGNTIHIGEVNDRELFNNISIDYEITAPADVALNLHTGSGGIEVIDLGRFRRHRLRLCSRSWPPRASHTGHWLRRYRTRRECSRRREGQDRVRLYPHSQPRWRFQLQDRLRRH